FYEAFCSALRTIMFFNDNYSEDNLNRTQESWTRSYSKRPVLKALKSTITRTTTKESALPHSTEATGNDTLGWNNYDNDQSFNENEIDPYGVEVRSPFERNIHRSTYYNQSRSRSASTPLATRNESNHQLSRKRHRNVIDTDEANFSEIRIELKRIKVEMKQISLNIDGVSTKLDESINTCNDLKASLASLTKIMMEVLNIQKFATSTNVQQENRPVITCNGINLTSDPIPPQKPTALLCRLIRKLCTSKEISDGIIPDERFEKIKEAIGVTYYPGDNTKLDVFWHGEAHDSILGQARAQRSRNKSFTCTRCSNGWSSAKATVEFYHRLDCGRGTIRMLLLGQQCKKCGNRNGTYSEPDFPSDVMEKILDNLHRCICEKYYGQPRVKNRNPENAKKMNGPHIRELCEACRKGICKEDRA
ncbi:unnamed protein product, partial [Didymodactylos carnosus]